MFPIERLANSIANKVAGELELDNNRRAVIAYGAFTILQTTLSLFLVILFGIIFNVTVEALIISFTVSILRKYSGGAHASSPGRCAAIGTIICIGLAGLVLLIINTLASVNILMLLGAIIFTWSFYWIFKLAPVHSPSKPIQKKEKRYRMKKISVLALSIYLIIGVINIVLYEYIGEKSFAVFALCIYAGTFWQVFTLTGIGHKTMSKMDIFLNQILIIKRGRR
jgi:accessory gene regulator B